MFVRENLKKIKFKLFYLALSLWTIVCFGVFVKFNMFYICDVLFVVKYR